MVPEPRHRTICPVGHTETMSWRSSLTLGTMQTPNPTRRRFLGFVGAAGASAWLAGCFRDPDAGRITVSPNGSSFAEPEVLSSESGRLELTLRAEPNDIPWGDSTRYGYTYNGNTPGPTLRVKPGDQLTIHLENQLDADTNLHTHGLHVSPSGNGDNIFVRVPPGGSRTYSYQIPADHRSGLFWYHPHAHGTVAPQVAAGLAGAIVITDQIDELPEMAGSTERTWILSDPPIGEGSGILDASGMDRMQGREGNKVLVNGIEQPDITTQAGVLERWRIVNASSSRYYRLGLDDHPLHIVATDGGRIAKPVSVSEILLSPGERAEFFVRPSKPGSYAFRALEYDRGGMGMGMGGGMMGGGGGSEELAVATMTVTGDAAPAALPAGLVDADTLIVPAHSASRVLELGMGGGGGGQMMSFTIDDKIFDGDRTDITAGLNTVEEWEIRNTSPMDHPLHLHVWSFLVADETLGSVWKDTINVPANQSVKVVVPFAAIPGRTVYHCHILDHEDLGMMGVIDVPG